MLHTGQLAHLVRPIAGDELRPVLKQLQNWAAVGLVSPIGPQNPGYGSYRRYDAPATLLAAIAVSMGRWRLPTAMIKLVIGALIEHEVRPDPTRRAETGRLAQIIAGKDLMLILQHVDGPKKAIDHHFVLRRKVGEFLAEDNFYGAGGSNAIVIDVPHLWRRVSAFGFAPQSSDAVRAAVEG